MEKRKLKKLLHIKKVMIPNCFMFSGQSFLVHAGAGRQGWKFLRYQTNVVLEETDFSDAVALACDRLLSHRVGLRRENLRELKARSNLVSHNMCWS